VPVPPARRLVATLLVGLALGGAAGCGTDVAGTSSGEPTASSTRTPAPVLWPLTGLESGPVLPHPALAVKIENSAEARPQTGLNSADIVWEQVVEGGISRFVAVYHSVLPEEVGPVRSVRPMDPAIAAPLHGLFGFSGGQAGYVDAVAETGTQVLSAEGGAAGYSRMAGRSAPHDLYAAPLALVGQADARHQADPVAQFDLAPSLADATAVTTGTPAGVLDLRLSGVARPSWTWDPAGSAWVRAEGGTPAVEADGSPLRATNVVVVRVDVVTTSALDPAGNPVPETVLEGRGEALVATGGATLPVTWVKNDAAGRLVLLGDDGNPVHLAPGTTWVELVPNGGGAVTIG
jgi:hypothetical protein